MKIKPILILFTIAVAGAISAVAFITISNIPSGEQSNIAPSSSFTYTNGTDFTSPVQFTDTSTDTDGSIVNWMWGFGDGNTMSDLSIVSYLYPGPGSYTVTLTVIDDEGAASTSSLVITIYDVFSPEPEPEVEIEVDDNLSPVGGFTLSKDNIIIGEILTVTSTFTDPDGSIISLLWNFNDGSQGSLETETHLYNNVGTYTIQLTATDNDGAVSTYSLEVTVNEIPNTAPEASFIVSKTTVNAGEIVTFSSSSTDPDGTIVSWIWNFGDDLSDSGPSVSHVYSSGGFFTASLVVIDNDGASSSKNIIISVTTSSLVPSNTALINMGISPDLYFPSYASHTLTYTFSSILIPKLGPYLVNYYGDYMNFNTFNAAFINYYSITSVSQLIGRVIQLNSTTRLSLQSYSAPTDVSRHYDWILDMNGVEYWLNFTLSTDYKVTYT